MIDFMVLKKRELEKINICPSLWFKYLKDR